MAATGEALTPRAAAIRKDLEALRKKELLTGPDWQLDYIATEVDRDVEGGYYLWREPKKPRKKKVKAK